MKKVFLIFLFFVILKYGFLIKDNFLFLCNLVFSGDTIGFIQYKLSKKTAYFEDYFLRKSADSNYSIAQYELAKTYHNKKNNSDYIRYLSLASNNKYDPAMKEMAEIYYTGYSINKDWEKAFHLYNKLDYKNTSTYCRLIEIQEENNIKVTNEELAQWYKFVEKCDFEFDYYKVAMVYARADVSYKKVYFIEKAASQGHLQAKKLAAAMQYERAERFMQEILAETKDGRAVYTYKKSHHKAAFYNYSKAADNGSRMAYFKLAYFYEHGIVVEKNLKTALKIYEDALESGEIQYEYNVNELRNILYTPPDEG